MSSTVGAVAWHWPTRKRLWIGRSYTPAGTKQMLYTYLYGEFWAFIWLDFTSLLHLVCTFSIVLSWPKPNNHSADHWLAYDNFSNHTRCMLFTGCRPETVTVARKHEDCRISTSAKHLLSWGRCQKEILFLEIQMILNEHWEQHDPQMCDSDTICVGLYTCC